MPLELRGDVVGPGDGDGALQAREVERLRRRRDHDRAAVPERGERRVRRSGERQRGVDLVGQYERSVPVGDIRDRLERRAVEHAAGRVVRAGEQQRAGARPERDVDAIEVELAAGQRHLDDAPAGLGDAVEERRIRRRRDDDAVARLRQHAQELDDRRHDVGHQPDPRGVGRPAEASFGEAGERLVQAGGLGVADVAELDRLDQRLADRRASSTSVSATNAGSTSGGWVAHFELRRLRSVSRSANMRQSFAFGDVTLPHRCA
jgi:hypothetical protein